METGKEKIKKSFLIVLSIIFLISSLCGTVEAKPFYADESDTTSDAKIGYKDPNKSSVETIYPKVVSGAGASITVYTDRSAWESAVNYNFEEEFFTDDILNPGVEVMTVNGYIDILNGFWHDYVTDAVTTTWYFAQPIYAYGADWNLAIPGGLGSGIQLYLDGIPVSPKIVNTYEGEFFGLISTVPFNHILVTAGTYMGRETYTLDNMVYSSWVKLNKTDDVNDDDCVGPHDEITYTIDYDYYGGPDYFDYEGLAGLHEWWLCGCNSNNNDCNGIDMDKDGIVNFIDFAILAENWLKGQVKKDVNIIDHLPAEVDFVSASNGGVYDSNSPTVKWEIGTLKPDDFGSVKLTVKVNESVEPNGIITNRCEIKSGVEILNIAYEYTPICWSSIPKPSCGEIDVSEDIILSWTPRIYADKHDVYLGTDYTAVKYANDPNIPPGRGRQDSNSYDPCGPLESDTTYYWRVDEVNEPNVWKGAVWRFRTGNWLVVEDFDSYADTGSLREIWKINYESGATNTIETTTARSGQSMKYKYDDIEYYYYFSEVYADTADLPSQIGTDWTSGGAEALAMYFYGQPEGGEESEDYMYVKLTDGDGNEAVVLYDGEVNDINDQQWHQWSIDLSEFSGADLNDVARITIGFGDGAEPETIGTVYFDDIRLYPSRCLESPAGDLTGDCAVDYRDVEIMMDGWLDTGYCCEADIYEDNKVDFRDFVTLAENWLVEGEMWP
ncbi:MAG: hypothetical protein PHY02_00015 [Phycisphaerae bacterium]|nr:hypothetical protein [Phycisphaerae bacterium]